MLLNFDRESVVLLDHKVGDPTNIDKETPPDPKPAAPQPSHNPPPPERQAISVTQPGGAPQRSASPLNPQGKAAGPEPDVPVCPIASLTPYNSKWTVKARVTSKTELKSWSNAKGEGKLFNMTLMDSSGEIKCTAFKDVAVMFHPIFEVNKVYVIGKGTIKMANARFAGSQSSSNYEMQLEKTSFVKQVAESDDASVPTVRYSFVSIGNVVHMEKDTILDLIAVVKECGDVVSIRSKATQRQLSKRDMTLVDTSSRSVRLTLWGDLAEAFKCAHLENPVVAFKGLRITEFNGKSLSSIGSTSFCFNPDIHEAYELRGWYDSLGCNIDVEPVAAAPTFDRTAGAGGGDYSNEARRPLFQIKAELAGASDDRQEYFSVSGIIARIKHTNGVSYPSCTTDGCNKKVVEMGSGQWKCEKCNQVFSSCNHRYMFTMAINDYSSSVWVNVFDDAGQIIFGGKKAEELFYLRQNDEGSFEQVVKECEHKMARFRIRAKPENYQGEQRMRYSLVSVQPIAFEMECRSILASIARYE